MYHTVLKISLSAKSFDQLWSEFIFDPQRFGRGAFSSAFVQYYAPIKLLNSNEALLFVSTKRNLTRFIKILDFMYHASLKKHNF